MMSAGFKLHDTMIYGKQNAAPLTHNRYEQAFEYMFVFSKEYVKTFHPFMVATKQAGKMYSKSRPNQAYIDEPTASRPRIEMITTRETKQKDNLWMYTVGGDNFGEHAAAFPEKLAEDHILSWSNPGDLVLDPFVGSGTTPKMAIKHHRQFIGIDISEEYCDLARRRIGAVQPVMFDMNAL
jgi:DNA modification methylase